jgi:2-amino-4-hydroxy-6-hydroxymethyldihydropteridine diphosphokinase
MSSGRSPRRGSPRTALIGLGGNLGDVLGQFRCALAALSTSDIQIEAVSRLYRSLAMLPAGVTEAAPDYWNAAARLTSWLEPEALLGELQALERAAGRTRRQRWASRTLDLDLLVFEGVEGHSARLTLPHPGIRSRLFVLHPLSEVAPPDLALPPDGARVASLLEAAADPWAGIVEVRGGWLRTPAANVDGVEIL